MLGRMQRKRNTHPLLVGVQTGMTTMEISVEVPQEAGKRSTSRCSCTTLGNVRTGRYILPQRHLLAHAHRHSISNSQKLDTA